MIVPLMAYQLARDTGALGMVVGGDGFGAACGAGGAGVAGAGPTCGDDGVGATGFTDFD